MPSHDLRSYDVKFMTSKYDKSRIDVARRKFEALDEEIHFESINNNRKNRCKRMK